VAYAELDPEASSDRITVVTQWTEKELIKQVPGSRWDSGRKLWTVPLAWASCVTLRGVFGQQLHIGPDLTAWAWQHRDEFVLPALELRQALTAEFGVLRVDDERLYDFQRAGVRFLTHSPHVLLADEMGTGKTVQTLTALRQHGAEALPALVICPNSVKRHWAREAKTWLPEATTYVVGNTAAKRRNAIKEAREDPSALVIINIEAVALVSRVAPYGSIKLKRCRECDPDFGDESVKPSRCEVHHKDLNGFGFRSVIIDEAHRIKNPQATQTRATWSVCHDPSIRRRIALTGTPIAQHPGDLWSIMHAIDPPEFPVRGKYIDRYCLTSWNLYGGIDIVGVHPGQRDELFSFLDPHFRRVTKAEVLPQLPKKIRTTRWVELTPGQRRMYRELEARLQTRTESGQLLLVSKDLHKALRLMQLASATCEIEGPPDDPAQWNVRLRAPSPKIDELEVVLEELGDGQCVVAAESIQLIKLAAERLTKLRIPHRLITGEQSEYDRDRGLEMLREGSIRVLLFTVKAGGTGLNMSCVDTLVNLQRSWSMIDVVQTEDRIHRIGSERHVQVRIIDIVAEDTVEEDQIERIAERFARLDEITRDRERILAAGGDVTELDNRYAMIAESHLGVPLIEGTTPRA
jgi:SNF2 family DNA or RNA helicase